MGGECVSVSASESVDEALHGVLDRFAANRIVTWARSELAEFELGRLWARGARAFLDPGFDEEDALRTYLLQADVGITSVDYAVAETGSVVLSASTARLAG